jgi:cytochrome c556
MKRDGVGVLAAVLTAIALGIGATASAAAGPDPVKARNDAMEDAGRAFKAIAAIAKKQAKFDAAVVKTNADVVAAKLAACSTLFPPGSEKGSVKSLAKPECFSDAAGLAAGLKASVGTAEALSKVTDEAAFLPAFKAAGDSCKGCHEKYRVPKT